MRVTGTHLIELTTAAAQRAQEKVAETSAVASSGLRVDKPSDDPAAWAMARRADDRRAASAARGDAIAQGQDRLQATDGALATIGDLVAQARSLAVQGASDGYGPTDRAALATQLRSMLDAAVAAGNARTSDGEYVLAGAQSATPPFDATGAYQGDGQVRTIEAGEGLAAPVGVPGSALTAAAGVDVLPALGALADALAANDVVGIRASIDTLGQATNQIALARGDAGAALASLASADDARGQLELSLTATVSRAVDADAVGAATDLARASQALEAAQAVAARVVALTDPAK